MPSTQSQQSTAPVFSSPFTGSNGTNLDSLPEAVQVLHVDFDNPQTGSSGHPAHVPSFSHISKERLPYQRPAHVRALSSHISEVTQLQWGPEDAKAEALRRLGKADRAGKTVKRRGSNESLSSLISYSIRRPSVPARPESGHSLDSLATVLEDAAQEGNLPLVEATMALGANPNLRSVHRLKNRRHDALNKATAAGHVDVIDYLLQQGATYNLSETSKKDEYTAMDYKLLDVSYSGYGEVARYLVTTYGANPFVEQWPREYFDATRTVYRRVASAKVYQRTVLDAIARLGSPEEDMNLLKTMMMSHDFKPSAIVSRVYEDRPYEGDGTRMIQSTYHYSALSAFVKAGWVDAVGLMLEMNSNPSAYEKQEIKTSEEGQIPSANYQRYIYPANALTKDTWLYRRQDAVLILELLINHGFDLGFAQKTADDSAPRTVLTRAISANAAEGVEAVLKARSDLTQQEVSFRLLLEGRTEQEYRAQPLAAAIVQGSLETARVILRSGADPHDPAFSYPNVMCFAAGHGGATATAMLKDMIDLAPDLLGAALETAIQKFKPDAVHELLHSKAAQDLSTLRLYAIVLECQHVDRNDEIKRKYLQSIELIFGSDTRKQIPQPDASVVQSAIWSGNDVGVQKLVSLGVLEDPVGA